MSEPKYPSKPMERSTRDADFCLAMSPVADPEAPPQHVLAFLESLVEGRDPSRQDPEQLRGLLRTKVVAYLADNQEAREITPVDVVGQWITRFLSERGVPV